MKTSTLRFFVLAFFTVMAVRVSAQFNVKVANSSDPSFKFVSAIDTEESTLIYVAYTSKTEGGMLTCGQLNAVSGYKKFKMKNCYNVPKYNEAEPAYVISDKAGQIHNFILEFEKLPMGTSLDIEEDVSTGTPWKFSGVVIDTLNQVDYVDPSDFINATPAKIYGNYASNGIVYTYYMNNGLVLTAHFAKGKNYGKYYQVYLDIINNTDHSVAFNTANVDAQGYIMKKDEPTYFALETLSADEYDKKVRSRQAWNSFFNALAESGAARNAGTTTVSTSTTGSAYGSVHTNSGYGGGYVAGATVNSSAVVQDGAIRYMAQQQAAQNIAAYDNALAYDRSNLWKNYLKVNTIKSGQTYGGFFNIKYKKADGLTIKIKIDGVVYVFPVKC